MKYLTLATIYLFTLITATTSTPIEPVHPPVCNLVCVPPKATLCANVCECTIGVCPD
ncbi:hypothetical protein JAAARDRAFT_39406 [Jaapia argillacea MUCL 33604]|uniref:Uncharacterized protein n=1 Tax=Jaapia argillacea MUCL 33604 TaxID=933084 RepID=A0A067PEX7_9AGAM|nr:hypothetical protein JAAARDRAFT_39406 [Jaapia argillacea MUCL 33604]